MSIVTMKLERGGAPARLDFITWKPDRVSFYAKVRRGKPQVIAMTAAGPEVVEGPKPFPACAPVRITRCFLLPPPCRASAEEWASVFPEAWESAWIRTHGPGLHLDTSDDGPLEKRIQDLKAASREELAARKKAALRIQEEQARQREIEWLDSENTERDYNLHVTLEMVKEGHGALSVDLPGRTCIRDAYMVERWAKQQAVDLAEMDLHRKEFCTWLQSHFWKCINDHDVRMKTREKVVEPLPFHGNLDPFFMKLCALVRFRVEFQDGPAAFVTDLSVRNKLRPEEIGCLKRDYGEGTARARKISAARRRSAKKKAKANAGEQKAIADEVLRFYAKMAGRKSKSAAGVHGKKWALERFDKKITGKTALNYVERTGGFGKS